jgi:hypothetical protein
VRERVYNSRLSFVGKLAATMALGIGMTTISGTPATAATASDCRYVKVYSPVSIGGGWVTTTVIPVLNGSLPRGAVTHATVQFTDDPSYRIYSYVAKGGSIRAKHRAGHYISSAKVWVTGSSRTLTCNLWMRMY